MSEQKGEWKRIEVKSLDELDRFSSRYRLGSLSLEWATLYSRWFCSTLSEGEIFGMIESGCPILEWVPAPEPLKWEGNLRVSLSKQAHVYVCVLLDHPLFGKTVRVTLEEILAETPEESKTCEMTPAEAKAVQTAPQHKREPLARTVVGRSGDSDRGYVKTQMPRSSIGKTVEIYEVEP